MIGSSRYITTLDSAAEPVTLAEAKAQLRVDYDTDDALINVLTSAARQDCENYLYTALINQRRIALFDCFGDLTTVGPVIAVESVQYLNELNVWTTVAATDYRVIDDVLLRIAAVEPWPVDMATGPGTVKVTYTCGPNSGTVSPVVIGAILLKVTDAYTNRENPTRAKRTLADNMLDLERIQTFS